MPTSPTSAVRCSRRISDTPCGRLSTPGSGLVLFDEEDFDLVVSDIVMPGEMDGIALARNSLAGANPGIPIVLITGYAASLQRGAGSIHGAAQAIPHGAARPGDHPGAELIGVKTR